MNATEPLLEIRDLHIGYRGLHGTVQAVNGVDLSVAPREVTGIVGESGSGKSQLLLAALGLLARGAEVRGSVRYRGTELLDAPASVLANVRGRRIGMIFQDPMSALNPYLTVERQMTEGAMRHLGLSRRASRQRAGQLLATVQIPEPLQRLRQYPHELSGGTRQRVVIAMALMCEPEVLLADEPTTALDVTVQAHILQLLRELPDTTGAAVVLVTHDLAAIAEIAARVCVMYAGRIVEQSPVNRLFDDCRHPYTEGLRRSMPALTGPLPARLTVVAGQPPDPSALPAGCAFEPRCLYRSAICGAQVPVLRSVGEAHQTACHYRGGLGRLAESPA